MESGFTKAQPFGTPSEGVQPVYARAIVSSAAHIPKVGALVLQQVYCTCLVLYRPLRQNPNKHGYWVALLLFLFSLEQLRTLCGSVAVFVTSSCQTWTE